jgi:hypothetical protein
MDYPERTRASRSGTYFILKISFKTMTSPVSLVYGKNAQKNPVTGGAN